MINKKGQITWFIIVGIIILISVGFLYIGPKLMKKTTDIKKYQEYPLTKASIKDYVESCLNEVTIPGIYLLASKGGYLYSHSPLFITEYEQIAYHLEYDQDVSPSKEFMQDELSKFIKDSLNLCLNNFEVFEFYDIQYGEMNVESIITDKDIFVKVYYPVTIKQENSQIKISDFITTIPIRLGSILDIKDDILKSIKNNKYIDLDYLSSQELEITLLPYDKQNLVYSLFDNQSGIYNNPFIFNFAVKVEGNSAPELDLIPDFVLTKGKTFVYDIDATDIDNDILFYYSDYALINIEEKTGLLNFTPLIAGNYSVEVCVMDIYLAKDCSDIKLMIEDE